MNDVGLAMERLGRGPKGGDLERKAAQPEARRASHNGERDPETNLPTLHRFVDTANIGRMNEQPWHRMAAFMMVAGRTNIEIAKAAGVHDATVSQLRSQRWFQELLADITNQTGAEVIGILKAEAVASVLALIDIRDNAEKDSDKLKAAATLLEHAKGKPAQSITVSAPLPARSPEEEAAEIDRELEVLRQKES